LLFSISPRDFSASDPFERIWWVCRRSIPIETGGGQTQKTQTAGGGSGKQ
jgi:hypothetical protein